MTYIRRAVKYFVQMTVFVTVIIFVLMQLGMVSKNIAVAFQHGWTSVAWILGCFALVACIYPIFGYQRRKIYLKGDPAEARGGIVEAMQARGYVLSGEADGQLKFHLTAPLNRAFRFWEDTITLTPVLGGWEAEGLSRDLVRVVSSIEHKFRDYGND